VALITGGSRGIGAATAHALSERGYDVAFTYRNKEARAAAVASAVEQRGARCLALRCDITRQSEVEQLFERLHQWRDHLNLVVLNASGGLERDLVAADPAYPLRINRDAQLSIVEGALPLMPRGGQVVFVTSHWAHLFGQVAQLPRYAEVAQTKYAGEQALRAREDALGRRGIRLLVVTGDLVEGTITPKLLELAAPGLTAARQDRIGGLPDTRQMAEAIVTAALDPSLPSGHTVVVGGTLASLPPDMGG
jgi:NAD(P)-dependent dehydrogenase (short-subunit alcohol dehydrogenase family)